MKHASQLFQGVPKHNVQKSNFNLSHEWKHDMTVGILTPCLMLQTMPGDEFNISSEYMFKCEPLYFPLIHRLNMEVDYYFIPNRIMWQEVILDPDDSGNGWVNWIQQNSDELHPTIDVEMRLYPNTTRNESVMGYCGLPYLTFESGVRSTTITGINAFPAMAYLCIYDEYYREPELETPRRFNLQGGDNTSLMIQAYGYNTPTDIRLSCFPAKWAKDYITSALPQPQIDAAIQIPMVLGWGIDAAGEYNEIPANLPTRWMRESGGNAPDGFLQVATTPPGTTESASEPGVQLGLNIQETAATIKELRLAEVLQSYRERLIKIGRRYRDYIIGMFGNDPTPGDVSVPIMIGNYRGTIQISEVLTKANTLIGETNYLTGDYGGNASLYEANNQTIKFTCREHGLIMAILSVCPNTGYGQGIERYWRYSTPVDYPMDIFSTIGDQEILKEEVMYNNVIAQASKNQETFGYIPRFSEARFKNNQYGTNLLQGAGLSVHMGKYYDPLTTIGATYDTAITINRNFLELNPQSSGGARVEDTFRSLTFPGTGTTSMNPIYAYAMHTISVMRNLPVYSTPKTGT